MPLASVRVSNPSAVARVSTFQAVVPFPQAAVTDVSLLTMGDVEAVDFERWGLPWPDGSVRMAKCWARVAMAPGQTKVCDVVFGTRPTSARPEVFAPTMAGMPAADPEDVTDLAVVSRETATHPWGRLTARWHLRYDLHQPVVHWRLTLNYSEPQRPDLWIALDQPVGIMLPPGAGKLSVSWAAMRAVGQVEDAAVGQVTTFLPAGLKIAHGQCVPFQGVYIADPALWEAERKPLLAVAQDWPAVGCGPTMIRPTFPPWMPTLDHVRQACARKIVQRDAGPARDPFYEPKYGLGKTSAETGAQDDFGVIHGLAGFLGAPEWLDIAMCDALQEFCTPTHFREADGRPIAQAQHPGLNRWMGRPHEGGTAISPDQLGKKPRNQWTVQELADWTVASHGWINGRDPQHTSRLLAWATLMQTGDPQLEDLLLDSGEEFLGSQTLPSTHPHHFSSGMDAARAVGRTLQDASWQLLMSARADVGARIVGRIDQVIAPAWAKTAGRQVRPLDIVQRVNLAYDPTYPPQASKQPREWHPWQEGMAVHGLLCAYFATQHTPAMVLASGIADTFLRWGWQDRSPAWQIAKAIEYTGTLSATGTIVDTGNPVPTVDHPDKFISADQTDYRYWNMAAVAFVVFFGADVQLKQKAADVMRSMPRVASADQFFGTWDRFAQQ